MQNENSTVTSFDAIRLHIRQTFLDSPECLITRVQGSRENEREVIEQIVDEADKPTLPGRALTRAQNIVADEGGMVEVWLRVGCYKGAAQEWD